MTLFSYSRRTIIKPLVTVQERDLAEMWHTMYMLLNCIFRSLDSSWSQIWSNFSQKKGMEGTILWILEQLTQKNQVPTLQNMNQASTLKKKKNGTMIWILKAKNTVFKEKYILTLSLPPPLIRSQAWLLNSQSYSLSQFCFSTCGYLQRNAQDQRNFTLKCLNTWL